MKRARYDGPHTSVLVFPWGQSGPAAEVQRGHQMPTEIDGQDVPASVRDELLARSNWSEVKQPVETSNAKKGD